MLGYSRNQGVWVKGMWSFVGDLEEPRGSRRDVIKSIEDFLGKSEPETKIFIHLTGHSKLGKSSAVTRVLGERIPSEKRRRWSLYHIISNHEGIQIKQFTWRDVDHRPRREDLKLEREVSSGKDDFLTALSFDHRYGRSSLLVFESCETTAEIEQIINKMREYFCYPSLLDDLCIIVEDPHLRPDDVVERRFRSLTNRYPIHEKIPPLAATPSTDEDEVEYLITKSCEKILSHLDSNTQEKLITEIKKWGGRHPAALQFICSCVVDRFEDVCHKLHKPNTIENAHNFIEKSIRPSRNASEIRKSLRMNIDDYLSNITDHEEELDEKCGLIWVDEEGNSHLIKLLWDEDELTKWKKDNEEGESDMETPASFNCLYKVLAAEREDRRIHSAVKLWDKLWLQEEGLPYIPLMKKLAEHEFSGEKYSEYRDHVVHSLWVYLLGLHLYRYNRKIRESIERQLSKPSFLKAWKIAALFHDIGYTGNPTGNIDEEDKLLQPLLDELQLFVQYPLHKYFNARSLNLSKSDEDKLRQISGRTTPDMELTLDNLEVKPLPRIEEKLLNDIEKRAISTHLAQEGQETPLQNYYNLARYVKPEPEKRNRFRDHGILSALILLHQFYYFDYCLEILKDISLPNSISRESRKVLSEVIQDPVTQLYEESVLQAATAIALHNVNVEIWDTEEAKKDPYHLSLQDYRITLEKNPLAFLLTLTDVLQCWDRPKRRYVDRTKDLSIPGQDVRIVCEDNVILWSIKPDEEAGEQLISPTQEIEVMSEYMALREKGDLDSLIKEN